MVKGELTREQGGEISSNEISRVPEALREKILRVVYAAVDSANQQSTNGQACPKSPAAPLIGADSALDSIGFITLVVAVEQGIEDAFGTSVPLTADEQMLTSTTGPFRSIGALTVYLSQRLRSVGDDPSAE